MNRSWKAADMISLPVERVADETRAYVMHKDLLAVICVRRGGMVMNKAAFEPRKHEALQFVKTL